MKLVQNTKLFYSNAKLMITGEYLVLKGAKALSIPLKKGQGLKISEHQGNPSLVWKTFVKGQHWFDAVFSLNEFVIGNTNDFPTAQNLRELLLAAKKIRPGFLADNIQYEATSELDFDINWGLGSSSSLMANIACWAEIDAFDLFSKVSSGSGYDLATSMSDKPILYHITGNKPSIGKLDFYPVFHEHLYFVYLGRKRNSAQEVKNFNGLVGERDFTKDIMTIDSITNAMSLTTELQEFRKLMREHEKIISGLLDMPPLSDKIMQGFNGEAKSLGAWGGDFALVATEMNRDYVSSWFRKQDFQTWFRYEELALNPLSPSM